MHGHHRPRRIFQPKTSFSDSSFATSIQSMSSLEAPAESSTQAKPNGKQAHQNSKGTPTSSALRRRLTHIPAKQPVLLRLPSGKFKSVELHPGKVVSLGKFGSFKAEDIIGLPYGLTYEIVNNAEAPSADAIESNGKGKAKKSRNEQQPGSLKVVISQSLTDMEETSATNEMINDDQTSQTLTMLDIQALKELGAQGRLIVQKGVEGNSSFQQRTSWSQQKYVMRKESKHLQLFTPMPPTLTNLCDFFNEKFDRESDKLRGLRADSLANILSLAGVAPGGKYIVVDGTGGAVAGAMLERMGGEGRLLALNDADSPPAFDLLTYMDLPPSTVNPVLKTLHWASTDKDWTPTLQLEETDELTPTGKMANDRDKQRFRKRKAQFLDLERTRQELFDGDFDGLVIACPYETVSMVDRLLPYLGGSSHIVVHHPYLQPLTEAHAQLRLYHSLIDVSITEPFMRKYQVLPGRMHPEMTTSATGGYILHAIRVFTDEETRGVVAKENQRQDFPVEEDNHLDKRVRLDEIQEAEV
jgi:tRNA (adenine-N(1)-)-methyltransferase non-catalytic subunit